MGYVFLEDLLYSLFCEKRKNMQIPEKSERDLIHFIHALIYQSDAPEPVQKEGE